MKRHSANLVMAIGLILAGCATPPHPAGPQNGTTPPTTLNPLAQTALSRAETDVQTARTAFTLWLAADDALSKARAAAELGDNETVIQQAAIVSDLCRLSAQQADYPSTEPK
jgi:hypothetical protein